MTSPASSTSTSTSSPSSSSPFSSNPITSRRKPRVSPEHTLNRVRENQRRHRARQRDHVASLEQRLAETERLLAAAREEIEALRGERDVAEAFVCLDVSRHFERMDVAGGMGVGEGFEGGVGVGEMGVCSVVTTVDTSASASATALLSASLLTPPPSLPFPDPTPKGPPPCCADDLPSPTMPTPTAAECTSCATRPPPSPSESTTLCAQAFVLISQRNVRNLDPALIRLWLSKGYRRASREGEGCRVEDGTLRGLLEYISGV